MRIFVAGASGLVGTALSQATLDQGHELIVSSREDVNLFDFKATLDFIEGSKPDVVIDAAARVGGIQANSQFPVDFLLENLMIQENLMKASYISNVSKFVFLGSSCIYPRLAPQPIREEYLLTGPLEETNSAYAIAKIAGLELVKSFRKQYGKKWISLMPTNIYGPNDNFNLETSHVLPALIRKFVEAVESDAKSVTLWGTGVSRREFLHANDLAKAVFVALDKYDSILHLNIGTGADVSIKELATLVASQSGYKGEIVWDSSKPDGSPRKVLDVKRIMDLGWQPEIELATGIASTIKWYREADRKGGIKK